MTLRAYFLGTCNLFNKICYKILKKSWEGLWLVLRTADCLYVTKMYQTFQKSAEKRWYVTKNQRNILNLHSWTMLDHKNAYAGLTFFPVFLHSGIPAFTYNCGGPLVNVATWWATLHLSELRCTIFGYAALLNYTAYCWALCCTLLSYPASYWHSLHPLFELCCTLWATLHPLSYAAPHWAALHSN
jgi:hypothetical protein